MVTTLPLRELDILATLSLTARSIDRASLPARLPLLSGEFLLTIIGEANFMEGTPGGETGNLGGEPRDTGDKGSDFAEPVVWISSASPLLLLLLLLPLSAFSGNELRKDCLKLFSFSIWPGENPVTPPGREDGVGLLIMESKTLESLLS